MESGSACIPCLIAHEYERVRLFPEAERKAYLKKVCRLFSEMAPGDTSVYMSWKCERLYEDFFGEKDRRFEKINWDYNEFVMGLSKKIQEEIEASEDPLETALLFSRTGNYIDFGALKDVRPEDFIRQLEKEDHLDPETYKAFREELKTAKTLLLLADNSGEIALDKLLIEVLKEEYPQLEISVMVKGGLVLNDATRRCAAQVGLDHCCRILDTGNNMAGCDLSHLGNEAKDALLAQDLILAKGQANFETLWKEGLPVYYLFLCKCEHFSELFQVEPFTGLFIRETEKAP